MKRHEILKRALELCVCGEDGFSGEKKPFNEKEYQVATDGYTVLWIKDEQKVPGLEVGRIDTLKVRKSFYNDSSEGDGIMYHYRNIGSITRDWMIFHQIEPCEFVQIGDVKIRYEMWKRMELVMEFLGLDGWDVDHPDGGKMDALIFRHGNVDLDDNAYALFIMGCVNDLPATRIELEKGYQNLSDPDDPRNRRYGIDEHEASLYIERYDAWQKKVQEELRAKRLGNLWEVQVAKYAYMYVEAADEAEAKELAKKHYDDADEEIFDDSDWELEGVQGTADIDDLSDDTRDDLTIYTVDDGMMSKNDYIEKLKEAGVYEEDDE